MALTILYGSLTMQYDGSGPDQVSVLRNREVPLIQMSGIKVHVSIPDRLGPSMGVRITEVSLIQRSVTLIEMFHCTS